jgi:hypothetical protein
MGDRKKAAYDLGEQSSAMAVAFLEGAVRDIEIAARAGYSHDDFTDVTSSLKELRGSLDNLISNISEAAHCLGGKEEKESYRHEFRINIQEHLKPLVLRL